MTVARARELGARRWTGPAYFTAAGVAALASPSRSARRLDAGVHPAAQRADARRRRSRPGAPICAWNLLRAAAPVARARTFFDESFRFSRSCYRPEGAAAALEARRPQAVDGAMGEALGKAYVATEFPPQSKTRMLELVDEPRRRRSRERIDSRAVDERRDQAAGDRASSTRSCNKIGYPDSWRDYTTLADRSQAAGDREPARARSSSRQTRQLRQDRQAGRPHGVGHERRRR